MSLSGKVGFTDVVVARAVYHSLIHNLVGQVYAALLQALIDQPDSDDPNKRLFVLAVVITVFVLFLNANL